MDFDWKATVRQFAPMIGTALGGPVAGLAIKTLTSSLGLPEGATEPQIEQAVQNATPEQLLAIKNADHAFKLQMKQLGIKEDQLFTDRTLSLEGTASDLKSVPFFGPMVIFARGCQRPLWGFATMYMDFQVFSAEWVIPDGTKQDIAFLIINLLVLGFLFGERAIKNLAPLIEKLLKK